MNTLRRRWAARHHVLDPLVVGLVSVAVYALHGYQGVLNRDLGVFTYGGQQVARGVPPYVGIFNSVGPLADAVPGLAIWLGQFVGLDPILAARLLFTLLSGICCALLSVLARDVLHSRAAAFVAPAVFLTFECFLVLASGGPREKTTMALFLLATLVLAGRQRWLAAGVCTALATLAWQPVLLVAVAAVAVALLATGTGRLRGAVRFTAGGLATAAVAALGFLLAGALPTAIEGFVSVNISYSRQPSAFSAPRGTWRLLWQGYHSSLWVMLVGLVALLVLAARDLPAITGRVWLGAGALAGIAWTLSDINGAPDVFELLPFAALGVAAAVETLARRLAPRRRLLLTVAVTATATVAATVMSVTTRSDLLVEQQADVAAVLAAAPPGATVLSVNAPEVLAIAGMTNPTSHQIFNKTMDGYLDHTRPGGTAGYAAWVGRERPTFVVVGRDDQRPWLDPVVARDYWLVGRATRWYWYLSRTAGPEVRAAVVAANDAVTGGGPSSRTAP